MKNIIALAFAATLSVCQISCGPSEADKKADSAQFDTTKKEMKSTEDRMIDSMNAEYEKQKKADSTLRADSLAKMKK